MATLLNQNMENWKQIDGYERYEISSLGNVRSHWGKTPKILRPRPTWKGYFRVALFRSDKVKDHSISRLVAIHFVPNPENKPEVNHINGIKADNRVENLEWNTSKENVRHSRANGLNRSNGEHHYFSKLTEVQVRRIRLIKEVEPSLTQRTLAKMFNVTCSTIYNVLSGKSWKKILWSLHG